jgi:hypothetical protein
MKNKSQIQIGETIVVLFVFIILIVIGLVAYSGFQSKNSAEKEKEQSGLSANEIALRAMLLPEISCTNDNNPTPNCFDRVRLENSSKIMLDDLENQLIYSDLFLYSNITVSVIFPDSSTEYTIYTNLPMNWTSKLDTIVPVTIFEPMKEKGNEYSFGLLKVEVYN